jgi:hypothetical protein
MERSKLERLLRPVTVPLRVKADRRVELMRHPAFRHVDDVELYHQAKLLAPSVLVADRASANRWRIPKTVAAHPRALQDEGSPRRQEGRFGRASVPELASCAKQQH